MKIVTISGSARQESSNTKLLNHLIGLSTKLEFHHSALPRELPLFTADTEGSQNSEIVLAWRRELREADGVIICIPEYIFNMPALIKNALEWIAASGELVGKKVLAMTLTPNEPRGEKAMQSLLWSLQALDANIVASLAIYQTEISYSSRGILEGEGAVILKEALDLFV